MWESIFWIKTTRTLYYKLCICIHYPELLYHGKLVGKGNRRTSIGHCPHLWNPPLQPIHQSQQSYCLWYKYNCLTIEDFAVQAWMVAVETYIDVGNILWIFYDCLYSTLKSFQKMIFIYIDIEALTLHVACHKTCPVRQPFDFCCTCTNCPYTRDEYYGKRTKLVIITRHAFVASDGSCKRPLPFK